VVADESAVSGELAEAPAVTYPFSFTGRAGEYFRIWIVNLALSVLTLGIFSAWAKIRTQRWFYGNTWVADAPFEYTAPPMAVLKGRIIGVTVLGVYLLVTQFFPVAEGPLFLALLLATPWLILSGLRFRARYSAWRTINFSFDNDIYDAGRPYLLYPMVLAPTLGLAYPWIRRHQVAFGVEGHLLGPDRLEFSATTGEFYRTYGKVFLLGLGAVIATALVVAGISALLLPILKPLLRDFDESQTQMSAFVGVLAITYLYFVVISTIITARIGNLTYNSISVAGQSFRCTLRARDLLALYLTNTVAVLLSLGLLIPWAQVRMARYRAAHLQLISRRSPLDSQARHRAGQGAAGAETADVMDVDLSL
jgi:uncharacterized membrane protein YjgN (DUF898 family)